MSIAAGSQTALENAITTPIYLTELHLDTTRYYSSVNDITHSGQLYSGGIIAISSATDWETIKLKFIDANSVRADYLLTGYWRGQSCKVWLYVSSTDDAIELFDGILTAAVPGPLTQLTAKRRGEKLVYTPNIRLEPPLCNHLDAPGTTITWDGQVYELQPG